ncbi:hypothetical protein AMATHDRAFT_76020 [Amanita thiersii Skay4041]|uniref:CRAL-TRIO domain-containing protein n=1 Tax=Amanita thiersii Skay4041 TaxID=703135 RepID=A0A2A9NPW6_9AGAR|nr:hypothetical protein AMATHDRAFT_76020 [Amanita thiersii Skay4041]
MDIHEHLQANRQRLLEQYNTNLETVLALQATLLRDILPSVRDELDLSPDATEWARDWLCDTSTLFRILKRNNFTRSFALEAVRKNLLWRLNNLRPGDPHIHTNFLQHLPHHILDPLGRPIVIMRMLAFSQNSDSIKPVILHAFEKLRLNLKELNDSLNNRDPALQYMVLLDLDGLLLQNLNIELIAWTLREVIPRFPGMLAGVFILKYSWTHSGLWNIVKRLLPVSALSRVFFSTDEHLQRYFSPSVLPKDYGGTLPFLTQLEDTFLSSSTPIESHASVVTDLTITQLPPTSLLNPFYGYPVSQINGLTTLTTLPHGRRRKRDLATTLSLLFWVRWRRQITLSLIMAAFILTLRMRPLRRCIHVYKDLIG